MQFRLRRKEPEIVENQPTQYAVAEFALKHGLSIFEARHILREAGQSREKADNAATRSKNLAAQIAAALDGLKKQALVDELPYLAG